MLKEQIQRIAVVTLWTTARASIINDRHLNVTLFSDVGEVQLEYTLG